MSDIHVKKTQLFVFVWATLAFSQIYVQKYMRFLLKQYISTTWLFPLGLSPFCPWRTDPRSDNREMLLQSAKDEEEALSFQPSLLGTTEARS